jgi:TRAP-type mannitol/chloroaromatic compound transport system permease large subunit
MGIDLIWFGVLLAVNMQTSFIHPPFGFALFYLRSVAPKEDYRDRVTGQPIAKVATSDIYWGSIPFIIIQVLMVGAVLLFPGMVTHYKGSGPKVNPASVNFGQDSAYGQDSYGGNDAGAAFQ